MAVEAIVAGIGAVTGIAEAIGGVVGTGTGTDGGRVAGLA